MVRWDVVWMEAYICLSKSFVNANGYYMEYSRSSAVTEQTEEDLRLKQELLLQQQVGQVNDNDNDTFDDNDKKSNEDPVKILQVRLARGEITPEQYQASLKLLQMLGSAALCGQVL
jgi:hypothetical protein